MQTTVEAGEKIFFENREHGWLVTDKRISTSTMVIPTAEVQEADIRSKRELVITGIVGWVLAGCGFVIYSRDLFVLHQPESLWNFLFYQIPAIAVGIYWLRHDGTVNILELRCKGRGKVLELAKVFSRYITSPNKNWERDNKELYRFREAIIQAAGYAIGKPTIDAEKGGAFSK